MKDAARIRSMFASISRRYDLLNHLLSLNRDKQWREEAVAASGLEANNRVLDVCSGTADLALAYSRRLGPDGMAVGADFCPEMLRIGKQKARSANGRVGFESRVELVVADALALPFADNTFDVVSVAFGIRNVADMESGISEMSRVAKAGGRVVILEFSMPDSKLVGGLYKIYFTRILPLVGRVVSGANNDAYSYLPDSVLQFPQGEEMREIMRARGLKDVSARRLTGGIVTLYVGRKDRANSRPPSRGDSRR